MYSPFGSALWRSAHGKPFDYCHRAFWELSFPRFMFAIVDIAGFQEKAEKGMKMRVPSLEAKEGDTVTFEKVLLLSDDGSSAEIGKPYVTGGKVEAKVLMHGRADKIVVRKFKRRKRYHKTLRGHRQGFTEIEIVGVGK